MDVEKKYNPQATTMIYRKYINWQPESLRLQNYVVTIHLSAFRGASLGKTEVDGRIVDTINIPIQENELGLTKKGTCWCNMMAVKVDEDTYNESHILLPIYSNGYYSKLRELGFKNVKLGRMHKTSQHRSRSNYFAQTQNNKLIRYSKKI